ncbi:thiol:disulfide interchange protein DsbA/DsbL [Modicisalibacter tunisiensis]|uniref:Thiol:disulfide interchange protein n=1 Tax=Modicisalibacter tunisiensis TaxID=390637 RepID=A0ABS7WVT6_9GAMM|nr:thiol:disulfide interchange protein DsbA/DsbL [Modicisalibacter tunisiensis]MBZ9539902.1 thiol:disulfide interchange protein DsbA/DsbL [Modicisalibacter tunisiensis]MBZ9566701.1 thiol:disulfide interchange protein DsbA/DsbL [Modicisalibacter tunisiensis]
MLKQWIAAVAGLGFSALVMAAPPVAGEDYKVLDTPVETSVPDGQIEVTEVFWYGCPHCYAFEKPLNAWVAELPDDVTFMRVPATMGDTWTAHARAFYAAKSLGILDKVHDDFFDAIHKDGRHLTDPEKVAEFFSHYGVTKDEALKALDSFGVKSELNQAHARMRGYQIMGVPALIVDGHYVVTPQSAGSLENMPRVADALIDKVREQRSQ